MKDKQLYKSIFLAVILLFGVLALYSLDTDNIPRFIRALGRFHPLLLHLPIGALVVTFFIDVLGRLQKNYSETAVRNLLGFTAIFAIVTCFLGHFLSLEDGYEKDTLDIHFYTGITTAILSTVLFFISLKPKFKSNILFLPLFMIALISISVTGHYGSVLTHGDQFLTEYISASEEEKTIEVVDSLRLYPDVIAKILDDKCIKCHNTSKQKGALSLISKDLILKGGASGAAVDIGNAENSLLYSRLILPISDEAHMPPEGKSQLTKDEIWLIEHWINNGVDFENYATVISKNDTLQKTLQNYLVLEKLEIPKADKASIEALKQANFRVLELVPGKAPLNIKFLDSAVTELAMEKLLEVCEQVVELDFDNAKISDKQTFNFKRFKNLKTLRMNHSAISDNVLANLKSLKQLEVLNIYNTRITDEGLSNLLKSIQPKRIYSWNTNITQERAETLTSELSIEIQNSIVSGFVENSQLEPPLITPEHTLFTDTIHVNSISQIKNAEIRYTLDGTLPHGNSALFEQPLILEHSKTLNFATFKKGWDSSAVVSKKFIKIDTRIVNFKVKQQPDERYPNPKKLFDMSEGSLNFKDGHWVGYFGKNLSVTMDLGELKQVEHLSISCLEDVNSWILYPEAFTVYMSSSKNGIYKPIGNFKFPEQSKLIDIRKDKFTVSFPKTKGRYFKVEIKNHDQLPYWHPSAGKPSWLFVDEIFFW